MRPLIVGEAPGRTPRAKYDLPSPMFPYPEQSAGARLQRLTGLSRKDYLRVFCRINLMPVYGSWSLPLARMAADNLMRGGLLDGRRVILVGVRVAEAFGLARARPFTWLRLPNSGQVAKIPHPSGRNRWYNNPENKAQASAFMWDVAHGPSC